VNKKLLKKKQKALKEKLNRTPIGYHVYRSTDENLPFAFWARLTDEPIPDGNFSDPAATIGQRFFYKLTEVYSDGKEGPPYTPKSSFTDHAGNVHDQNPLQGFVGYNMYRSANKDVPLDQWERRNREPIKTNEYKDDGVESGEEFYYYVRAVDSKGNESAPGEIFKVIRS
jgi:hypothetical protein